MVFVNPYTFVGFPEKVVREPPLFHNPTRAQAKERYTGKISVTWTLKSPLAIPSDGSWGCGDGGGYGAPLQGDIRIPGASAKGAVRSLHETLFAGCARVIDPLFTPVYRELMAPRLLEGWALAVVVGHGGNAVEGADPVVQVMPCSTPVMWTRGSAVRAKAQAGGGRLPRTGDFVVPARPANDPHRQDLFIEVADFTAAERGVGWMDTFKLALKRGMSVILVTDTSARDARSPYYWATAKPNPAEGLKKVSPAALRRFRQRFRGADKSEPGAGEFEGVLWPPTTGTSVAQRRTVDGYFRQGDVIWIKMTNGEVSDIKLSLGWRSPTEGTRTTLESRIPAAVRPCRHIKVGLCLSCVVFGSVDATAADEAQGAQDSYGGHVRFGDITGECTSGRRNIRLVPLGTPHPGAGMFYLKPISHDEMEGAKVRPDLPSRWDSVAGESRGSRDLRGRKFYWHSNPESQRRLKGLAQPRFERQPTIHTNEDLCPKVHLVEQATLSQTITFDGLDVTALASLLATLSPALLLGAGADGGYALHLGRGKPLGLGSVQATYALEMTTTADRYAAEPVVLTQLPGLASALGSGIAKRCGDLTAIKREAAAVLALHGLGNREADVSYPTMKSWGQFNTDAFHESYEYFQTNSGQVRKQNGNLVRGPWSPLPLATEQQGQG